MNFLRSLEMGDHVFAVYPDQEMKIRDCFSFLKTGLDNNEVIFIMLDCLSKDEIYNKITREWNIYNIKELEDKGDVIITTAKEWYYHDDSFNTERILKKWESTFSDALNKSKEGLRLFIDVTDFFIEGLENALISYDKIIEKTFSFPFISVYAYKIDDVKEMTAQQFALMYLNHGIIWMKDQSVFPNIF